jgi:hypothetical protein
VSAAKAKKVKRRRGGQRSTWRVPVRAWSEALSLLNKRKCVVDGVEGVILVENANREDAPVFHDPTARGRASARYPRYLRDLHAARPKSDVVLPGKDLKNRIDDLTRCMKKNWIRWP